MPERTSPAEYERLAEAELRAAAASTDPKKRNAHLNQAAVYATLAEEARRAEPTDE